jgi:hypothetical protein
VVASGGESISFMVHIIDSINCTLAKNVVVQVALPNGPIIHYTARVIVGADNASPVSGVVDLRCSQPCSLQYISGSTVLYYHNYTAKGGTRSLPDGVTGEGVNIGDVAPFPQNERWVCFRVKVISTE